MLLALFAVSLAVRSSNIWQRPLLSHNEDATGHVLATMQGMAAAPVSVHKYLPIITLSQSPADRDLDNFVAASISDTAGNHFYVSFPPMGFVVPAIVFKAIGLPPSVVGLRLFSAALGLLTGCLFYVLILTLLRRSAIRDGHQVPIALGLSALMLFNSEALWIFGNVYWHHVLLEPIFVAILLILARLLERPTPGPYAALMAALVLACTIEWAAFPLAAGIALLGLHHLWRRRPGGAAMLAAGIVAPLCGLLFIAWHFSQIAGLQAYLDVLQNRASEHGWKQNAIVQAVVAMLPIYLPIFALGIVLYRARPCTVAREPDEMAHLRAVVLPVVFCAAAGSIEAVVLLKHTAKYTYGSLPLTTLLILLLLCLTMWTRANVRLLAVGTGISIAAWTGVYFVQNPPGLSHSPFGRQFENLAVIKARAGPDEMVFTNLYAPLGVPLAITGRNLGGAPDLPTSLPLAEMQARLARHGTAHGKLFLFDLDQEPLGQVVWWAYTKSRVVGTAERRYGPLAALVTFDRHGVTQTWVRPEANARRILADWTAGRPVAH